MKSLSVHRESGSTSTQLPFSPLPNSYALRLTVSPICLGRPWLWEFNRIWINPFEVAWLNGCGLLWGCLFDPNAQIKGKGRAKDYLLGVDYLVVWATGARMAGGSVLIHVEISIGDGRNSDAESGSSVAETSFFVASVLYWLAVVNESDFPSSLPNIFLYLWLLWQKCCGIHCCLLRFRWTLTCDVALGHPLCKLPT